MRLTCFLVRGSMLAMLPSKTNVGLFHLMVSPIRSSTARIVDRTRSIASFRGWATASNRASTSATAPTRHTQPGTSEWGDPRGRPRSDEQRSAEVEHEPGGHPAGQDVLEALVDLLQLPRFELDPRAAGRVQLEDLREVLTRAHERPDHVDAPKDRLEDRKWEHVLGRQSDQDQTPGRA